MTSSTPQDLAVAFRSFPRRLANAFNDETPPEAIPKASAAVDEAIAGAATVLGSAATAEAVAVAIEARHLSDWTNEDLAGVQRYADGAARAIREVENLSERA